MPSLAQMDILKTAFTKHKTDFEDKYIVHIQDYHILICVAIIGIIAAVGVGFDFFVNADESTEMPIEMTVETINFAIKNCTAVGIAKPPPAIPIAKDSVTPGIA